jgi:hypothetical protein
MPTVVSKRTKKAAARLLAGRETMRYHEALFVKSLAHDLRGYGKAIVLATSLQISPQYLSDIRSGKRGFTAWLLHKIARS